LRVVLEKLELNTCGISGKNCQEGGLGVFNIQVNGTYLFLPQQLSNKHFCKWNLTALFVAVKFGIIGVK
jgi:hypothetical protein